MWLSAVYVYRAVSTVAPFTKMWLSAVYVYRAVVVAPFTKR